MKKADYYLSQADIDGYDMLEILLELKSILGEEIQSVKVEDFGTYDIEMVNRELANLGV